MGVSIVAHKLRADHWGGEDRSWLTSLTEADLLKLSGEDCGQNPVTFIFRCTKR